VKEKGEIQSEYETELKLL
jgi:chromosome segregation ATPase